MGTPIPGLQPFYQERRPRQAGIVEPPVTVTVEQQKIFSFLPPTDAPAPPLAMVILETAAGPDADYRD